MGRAIQAFVLTIIAGCVGVWFGALLEIQTAGGIILSIATMGAFIISAIEGKKEE